ASDAPARRGRPGAGPRPIAARTPAATATTATPAPEAPPDDGIVTTGQPAMSGVGTRRRWPRPAPARGLGGGERRSPWLELFFGLCFVAAVAALAASLHDHPTWDGLA